MFDFEDREYIKKVIDSRKPGSYVIPLYVKIYNTTYTIMELDTITSFNPTAFKVGFGTSVGIGIKGSFPNQRMIEFDFNTAFNDIDSDTGVSCRYMIFESSDINSSDMLSNQINTYYQYLSEYISDNVKRYRDTLVDEDTF